LHTDDAVSALDAITMIDRLETSLHGQNGAREEATTLGRCSAYVLSSCHTMRCDVPSSRAESVRGAVGQFVGTIAPTPGQSIERRASGPRRRDGGIEPLTFSHAA
jgi:hypothetical protein